MAVLVLPLCDREALVEDHVERAPVGVGPVVAALHEEERVRRRQHLDARVVRERDSILPRDPG